MRLLCVWGYTRALFTPRRARYLTSNPSIQIHTRKSHGQLFGPDMPGGHLEAERPHHAAAEVLEQSHSRALDVAGEAGVGEILQVNLTTRLVEWYAPAIV